MLNKQQAEAVDLIRTWYKTYKSTGKQIFTLAGYAGTGKTFLLNYIIHDVFGFTNDKIAFVAPTGKAASVLIQKGCPATTIHRLIYTAVSHEMQTNINGRTVQSRKTEFIKKQSIGKYKLIVLDEVSMVSYKIMEDLLSYGIPILSTGDIAQLPAIGGGMHNLLEKPDYVLTEIVRQASDNAILQVATMAREGKMIPFGNYNDDVIVIDKQMLSKQELEEYLTSADQIICGKNATRIKINHMMRKIKGLDDKLVCDGEKLICELNNYEVNFDDDYSLVNGMSGYASNFKILDPELKLATISFRPDFLDKTIDNLLVDYNVFKNDEYLYEKHQNVYFMFDGSYRLQKQLFKYTNNQNRDEYMKNIREEFMTKKKALGTFMINQFNYGHVISCHKSQGSQWDYVVVIDEHSTFSHDADKWLYTAITRAAKKLIIIR